MIAPRLSRLALVAAVLLMVAACTDDAVVVEDTGGSASGEILPGSISDEMIASDTLQSQPPLMAEERAASGGTVGGAVDEAPEGAEDDSADESPSVEEASEE